MRLLLISREYDPMIAGVSKYVSEIMRRLRMEKTVLALKFGNSRRKDVEEVSYPPLVRRRSIKAVYFVAAVVAKALRMDFDVIVGNAFVGSVSGALLKTITGKPLVSIIYDIDFIEREAAEYGKLNKLARKKAIGAILALSDCVIADSDKVKRDIEKLYRINPKKVVAIPCGINPAKKFKKIPKGKEKIVLFVGNMAEKKGLTVLAHAMSDVAKRVPDAELWIVGPNADIFAPYKKKLKSIVASLGIEKNVRFIGEVKFVEPYYDACDFLVLPSLHSEGFGLPIIEAAYYGKPAIATKIFKETGVIKETTGLIIPAGDSKKLSSAILKLLENSALRKRMGLNAKRFVRKFDWDASAREFERVVKNLSA